MDERATIKFLCYLVDKTWYKDLKDEWRDPRQHHEWQLCQQGLGIGLTGGTALSVELCDADKPFPQCSVFVDLKENICHLEW